MNHIVRWPLGTEGIRTLLVLENEVEHVIAALESGPGRMAPAAISSLNVPVDLLARKLSPGPRHVFLLLPRCEEAYELFGRLQPVLTEFGIEAQMTLLPFGLSLEEIATRLRLQDGTTECSWILQHALLMLWAGDATDDELADCILELLTPLCVLNAEEGPPGSKAPWKL